MLHLGFDAKRLFNNFTGLGNYSRTLLRNLAEYHPEHAYFLYTPYRKRNVETQYFLSSPTYSVITPRPLQRPLWRSYSVVGELRRRGIDLYHGLSHELPHGLANTGIATVVTIHDLIFKHYPQQYSWIDRQIYDYKFRYACERADRIVAVSQATRNDVIEYYGIDPARVEVIYQSCDDRFMQDRSERSLQQIQQRYGLPDDYLLYVGSLIERKNLHGIIAALAQLSSADRLPLVVVGNGPTAYRQRVDALARELGVAELVQFAYPEFGDLPAIYQGANAFLYPSFYEGFGIPVIEALLSGTPVITSDRASLPEAAGPHSALVDPGDPAAIAAAIARVLTDTAYRTDMIEMGYQYAERFRAETLTQQMMQLYQRIL